jgi:hydroxyacylglutathione hydrolase
VILAWPLPRCNAGTLKELAPSVWQLRQLPPNVINVFLIEDVLVDAGTRHSGRRILRELRGREVGAHVLTHAHPDHQGASAAVCERLGIPFWVGERDADAAERPRLIGERQPDHWLAQLFYRAMTGPGRRVDRRLRDGDEVAGFRVIDTPGHSAGHICLFRESDRVLVAGDVLSTADPLTLLPGLREPRPFFSPDPVENRRSAKKLAPLEPRLVLCGHGPPFRDTRRFVEFVEGLPD